MAAKSDSSTSVKAQTSKLSRFCSLNSEGIQVSGLYRQVRLMVGWKRVLQPSSIGAGTKVSISFHTTLRLKVAILSKILLPGLRQKVYVANQPWWLHYSSIKAVPALSSRIKNTQSAQKLQTPSLVKLLNHLEEKHRPSKFKTWSTETLPQRRSLTENQMSRPRLNRHQSFELTLS